MLVAPTYSLRPIRHDQQCYKREADCDDTLDCENHLPPLCTAKMLELQYRAREQSTSGPTERRHDDVRTEPERQLSMTKSVSIESVQCRSELLTTSDTILTCNSRTRRTGLLRRCPGRISQLLLVRTSATQSSVKPISQAPTVLETVP